MVKIVIIDDDPDIVVSITLLLQASGYEIKSYPNAQVFLQDALTPPPDVYLIDKQMPGMDGLALCQLLRSREETKHIPVIIISASVNIRPLAQKAGASDSVEKPFTIKNLREVISKVLNNSANVESSSGFGSEDSPLQR